MKIKFPTPNDLIPFYRYWAKPKSGKTESDTVWKKLKMANPWRAQAGQIFTIYLVLVLIGGLLLSTPGIVHRHGTINDNGTITNVTWSWKFLFGLFNASSAFSDTGLFVANAAKDFSFWGQLIIALLIQLGGFGVLTFKIMLWAFLGHKFKIRDIILVQDERGTTDFGSTLKLIKQSFVFLILVELFAAAILVVTFYFSKTSGPSSNDVYNTYGNFTRSLWSGIFHSISAVNNAGFDIIGPQSLNPYSTVYLVQFVFMAEFIIGGIGFPTFYDLKKKKFGFDRSQRLTLFTKLNLITYLGISVVGVGLVSAIEYGHAGSSQILKTSGGGFNGFMAILFNTMSTRNAGFSTYSTGQFLTGSRIIQAIMMFIGSAPSSTAGGIRTTTLAILLIACWQTIRGKHNINIFKRSIPQTTVKNSGIVLFTSVVLVGLVTFIITAAHPGWDPLSVFYTICSAFGTVGLNNLSQYQMYRAGPLVLLSIILLMFVGQLGVTGTLLSWSNKHKKQDFKYPEENIRIG